MVNVDSSPSAAIVSGVTLATRPAVFSVAPLVPVVLAMAAGIMADRYGASFETSDWIMLVLAASTAAALCVRWHVVCSVVICAAVMTLGGAWHHHLWTGYALDDLGWSVTETPRPAWVRGVIIEMRGTRMSQGYGPGDPERIVTRMVMEITRISDGSQWRTASGRALVAVAGNVVEIHAGQAVEAAGQLSRIAGPLNPGEFDYRDFLRSQGIRLRLSIDDPASLSLDRTEADSTWHRWLGDVRQACRARLTERLGTRTAPLASALILGQRDEIDPEDNDAFARTGTTHLLAISGLQLQILAAALALCFRVAGMPRRLAYFGVALATVGYSILVGLAPSVVRSAVMTLTFCLAAMANRPARPANTLALAGLVTLGWNPFFLFDVGCHLSFLAIAALIWLVPPAIHVVKGLAERIRVTLFGPRSPLDDVEAQSVPWWSKSLRRAGGWVFKGLLASAVVWLAASPLVALRFHLVSPIGIFLNLPLIPLTSLALLLGALGMGLGIIWSPLGLLPVGAADGLLRVTETIVRWGVARPWGHRFVAGPSEIGVLVFYGLLCLATVMTTCAAGQKGGQRRSLVWQCAVWCMVLGSLIPGWMISRQRDSSPSPSGDVLAVGHGLAVVLQLAGGHTLLYDCGRMGDPRVGRRIIAPALWSRGVTRLDSVYLSHADQDHYNALPDLLDRFAIGEIVIPPGFANEQNPGAQILLDQARAHGVMVRTITAPAAWSEVGASFRVLHPPLGWHPETSDNARSLVLDVEHAGGHLLLTGDLDQLGLVELAAYPQPEPPINLMLAPHHGGKSANPPWLYDWARPRTIVVSQRMPAAGTADALAPLERSGIPLLRTWQRGAVHFLWRSDQIITEGFLDQHDNSRY
jgi:competence protein ComEC